MNRLAPLLAGLLLVIGCTESRTTTPGAATTATTPRAERPAVAQPSPQVREAQQRLQTLGMYNGPIDGIWGPDTQAAVQRFQRARGIQVTTRLDDMTLDAIRTAEATPVELSDPTHVRTVQNRLRQLEFYRGTADGVWGTRTQMALEEFQRARNLPVGQVTGQTLAAMGLDPATFSSASRTDTRSSMAEPLRPDVIRGVQRRLRQLGFNPGAADGVWGRGTQAAMERFQKSRGLEVTGTLNPTTATALGLDPNNLAGSAAAPRRR